MSPRNPSLRLPLLSIFTWFSIAVLLIFGAAPRLGAQTSAGSGSAAEAAPTFDDETSVIVVEIPVNVHVEGEPVRGLSREDFRVREGGRDRPLVGFEVVDLQSVGRPSADRPAAATPVPISARRHFLLLFDLSYTGRQALGKAVEGARDMLASALHGTDLVAVGFYGRSVGAGLLLGFTPDRRQVDRVIDQLGSLVEGKADAGSEESPRAPKERDPLRLVAGNMGSLMSDIGAGDVAQEMLEGLSGGRGGMLAETLFDMNRANMARSRSRARSELKGLTDALGEVADATAGVDGRKFLVYFSEGFDDSLLFEENLQIRSMLDEKAGTRAVRMLQDMADRFRRAGWTIQTVDPGGVRLEQGLASGDGLALMAEETGGESYRNFNDLGSAMERMLGKTAVTYVLSIQVDGVKNDGAFHELDIDLVDGPRRARLLHRPGYYAPSADDETDDAMASTFQVSEMLLSEENSGELDVSVLLAPFAPPAPASAGESPDPASAGETGAAGSHVALWLQVPGRELLERHPSPEMSVETYAYVLDSGGEIRDFFTRTLRLELAKVGERLRSSHLRIYGNLDLEPGAYDLRLLVRNPLTGRHALRSFGFQVPEYGEGQAGLLPPFFIDDLGQALVVRESTETTSAPYPFVSGEDEEFVPDIAPVVSSDLPRARIVLMGYNLVRDDVLLDAALLADDGSRLGKDRLLLVGRSETAKNGLDRLYFSLEIDGLRTGDFRLEVTLHDLGKGEVRKTFLPFRVEEAREE